MLFAKVPTVVGPHHDDGVVCLAAFFEGVEHSAEHVVGEVGGCKICLDGLLPLAVLDYARVVFCGISHFDAGGWNVFQVVIEYRGNLDRIQRKAVEIALRYVPREVRPINTEREKERLVVLFF